MRNDEQELAPWNAAAAFVFMCALAAGYFFLAHKGALTMLDELSGIDLILIALAAFRIAHLFTYDKMLNSVREYFMDARGAAFRKPRPGLRRLMCELLECIWCTTIWAGLIALFLYLLDPFGKFLVIILALAGAASLLQLLSKWIAAASAE